jgi:hypothetical protein
MTITQKNIYQRVLAVMNDVKYIQKGEKKAGGMFTFVSHDRVSEIIHPKLVEHGIAVIPSIKQFKQDGNRTECLLEVRFINADNPEDFFIVNTFGYGIDTADKGPGKCFSYSYKYALLKTFCLETGDDPDQDQNVVYTAKKISYEQYMELLQELEEHDDLQARIIKAYKIKDLEELEDKDFVKVLQGIRKEKAKK